ncbi:MAG: polyphosphate polymerase domain-containing protein [Solobacterium sp.]|nr:polyphosphate polymerase domain-containing protein [Solobacterium sp.]
MSENKEQFFQRTEDKYVINEDQAEMFLEACDAYIKKDLYYSYTVHSLYYDSPGNDLMIRGLEKPMYKTKIRLRSYGDPAENSAVYIETKKKFGDIVYKRRLGMSAEEATDYLEYGIPHHLKNNTADEIEYLLNLYNPEAKALILYDRTCYAAVSEKDVRITFDRNIRYRTQSPDLYEKGNEKLLSPGTIVMEIKVSDRYPMWLCRVLTAMRLYRSSFSKYGTIYKNEICHGTDRIAVPEKQWIMNKESRKVCSLQY